MKTEWVLDKIIPKGGVGLFSGESDGGKSLLALAIAGAVAHGTPFLGKIPTMQMPVLYVDGENPGCAVKERVVKCLKIPETDNLTIWGGWNLVAPQGPDFAAVIKWALKHQGLIIYDSLIEFHPGSEQDSSETRKYMTKFRALANIGASVAVIAHTGKGENAKLFRGSSDIKGSVDQAFVLEVVSESEGGDKTITLTQFKKRMERVSPLRLTLSKSGYFTIASDTGTSRTQKEIVIDIIDHNPNQSRSDIIALAKDAGVGKHRTEAILEEGLRDAWLVSSMGKRGAHLYRVRNGND